MPPRELRSQIHNTPSKLSPIHWLETNSKIIESAASKYSPLISNLGLQYASFRSISESHIPSRIERSTRFSLLAGPVSLRSTTKWH